MTDGVQAILCDRFGSTDDIRWGPLTLPDCGPDQVRYRTTAATVGFMDTLMVEGLYQLKPDLPYVPGAVSAGDVIEVGSKSRTSPSATGCPRWAITAALRQNGSLTGLPSWSRLKG